MGARRRQRDHPRHHGRRLPYGGSEVSWLNSPTDSRVAAAAARVLRGGSTRGIDDFVARVRAEVLLDPTAHSLDGERVRVDALRVLWHYQIAQDVGDDEDPD